MSKKHSAVGPEFEGRPLDLGDVLLYQKTDTGNPVAARLYEFEFGNLPGGATMHVYTLRELPDYSPRSKEHRLTLEELREKCTRDPTGTERRKDDRRKA